MRIISKFKDYYDGVQAQAMDKTHTFVRKQTAVDIPCASYGISPYRPWRGDKAKRIQRAIFLEYVVFCGKIYRYVHMNVPENLDDLYTPDYCTYASSESNVEYFYDYETFKNKVKEHKAVKRWLEEGVRHFSYGEDKNVDPMSVNKLIEFNAPIIAFTSYQHELKDGSKGNCIVNPCLQDIKFFKAKDPFTAFQEIEQFLTNDLAHQNDPSMPVGSDVVIAQSKGYDKHSFRMDSPGKKRKRKKK
jgi:hypothetical protein